MKKEIWVLVKPHDLSYTRSEAEKIVKNLSKRWRVELEPADKLIDFGCGKERKYIVYGDSKNIKSFERELNDLLFTI